MNFIIGTTPSASCCSPYFWYFTLGSFGDSGRGFLEDIQQVEAAYIASALIGGAIFNASNILLSASVSIAGMAVAFPLGVGLALVLGVFINYFSSPKEIPFWLFTGVVLIVIAIICNGIAAGKNQKAGTNNSKKGIILAAIAGILMSFFYRFVAAAMDLNNLNHRQPEWQLLILHSSSLLSESS